MNKYKKLLKKADEGDPIAIYEIAKLYDMGVLPSDGETYIIWLKRFFENETIDAILCDLDDEEGKYDISPIVPIDSQYMYYQCIIEAGLSLGLYYRFSSDPEELAYAQQMFYYAWIASRFDHIEVNQGEIVTNIVALMEEVTDRLNSVEETAEDD